MAGYIHPNVFDLGLSYLKTNADKIYICSAQPANYSEATTGGTYALGNKSFGAGAVIPAALADDTPTGSRKGTTAAVTDGSVTNSGTAGFWAIVYSGSSLLLAAYSLSATQGVTASNTFTLAAFVVKLTAPA